MKSSRKTAAAEAIYCTRERARHLDKFYTDPEVAAECVEVVRKVIGRARCRLTWLEPSAGGGAFFDAMPKNKLGFDIEPEHPKVIRLDFLSWDPGTSERFVTVGNPPFGKNASLAIRFFNHAAAFSEVIAFIVPRTFEKDSVVRRLHRNFHLARQTEVPVDGFTFLGDVYSVPCVFQVWERRDAERPLIKSALSVPDFQFVMKSKADFAFQRVGARAGTIYREFRARSESSHYFIRDLGIRQRVIDILGGINWDPIKSRTAGNPSIAKRELVSAYLEAAHGV